MSVSGRNFTFILYPDESPPEWLLRMVMIRVPLVVSPLHSPDILEDDEDTDEEKQRHKKRHHHVMICFSGKRAKDQVDIDIIYWLRKQGIACTHCRKVSDKKAMQDYFCHIGYPEKEQFDKNQLIPLCGYDIYKLDDHDYTVEIIEFIQQNRMFRFHQLVDYAVKNKPEWVSTLMGRKAYSINRYLDD